MIRRSFSKVSFNVTLRAKFFSATKINSVAVKNVKRSSALYDSHIHTTGSLFAFWKSSFQALNLKIVTEGNNIDENKEEVIGGNDKRKIVMTAKTRFSKEMCAVFDSENPFRAFVGNYLGIENNFTDKEIWGGIVYFDEKGQPVNTIEVMPKPLHRLDYRNGLPRTRMDSFFPFPSKQNLFLCGNTLAFIWNNRDSYDLTLTGALFDNDDKLETTFNLNTGLVSVNVDASLRAGRWLCAEIRPERGNYYDNFVNNTCFDLKSFRIVFEAQDEKVPCLSYDKATVPTIRSTRVSNDNKKLFDVSMEEEVANLDNALVSLTESLPSNEITHNTHGYPLNCIKCNGPTVSGYFDRGLGGGVCPSCLIRWSKSDNSWKCLNIVVNEVNTNPKSEIKRHCECNCSVFGPDFLCSKAHSTTVKIVKHHSLSHPHRKRQNETRFYISKLNDVDVIMYDYDRKSVIIEDSSALTAAIGGVDQGDNKTA